MEIYETYLSQGAVQQANVPATMFEAASKAYIKLVDTVYEALANRQQKLRNKSSSSDHPSSNRLPSRSGSDLNALSNADIESAIKHRAGRHSPSAKKLSSDDEETAAADTNTTSSNSTVGDDASKGTTGQLSLLQASSSSLKKLEEQLSGAMSTKNDQLLRTRQGSSSPKRSSTEGSVILPTTTAINAQELSSQGMTMSQILRLSPSSSMRLTATAVGGQNQTILPLASYTPAVKEALEECCHVLGLVQEEVLLLLEKDTLPRFKSSELFAEYVEAEPMLFRR